MTTSIIKDEHVWIDLEEKLTVEQIREELRSFVTYDRGEYLRARLHNIAIESYKPKHESLYCQFMDSEHVINIEKVGPQQSNFPYAMQLFSIASQHIYGDCASELLDNAIDMKIQGVYKHLS